MRRKAMTNEKFMRFYNPTDTFQYMNPNPDAKNKKTMVWDRGDCVIRAIALSIGCSWLEAFDFTVEKGRRDYCNQNDGRYLRKWLLENGATWMAVKAEKGKKRMTATDFARTHKEGHFIISLASHECACVDGKILDTWNCGEKCVVGYYDMSNFKL